MPCHAFRSNSGVSTGHPAANENAFSNGISSDPEPWAFEKTAQSCFIYDNTKDAIQTLTIATAPRNMAKKEYLAIFSDGLTATTMNMIRQAMKKPLM
jgi:hypothetical protein